MLESFLQGILLGFGVAVPFGPLNILILSYALHSFKNAFALGLGAMSADIFYLLLLLFGLLSFLNNEILTQIIAICGFAFLSFMAISLLKNRAKSLNLKQNALNESVFKSYAKGFILNLFNPYIIGFWASVSLIFSQSASKLFMVFGLFVAILLWVFSLSFVVFKFTHLFTIRTLRSINIISAVIIQYFALVLLYKVFMI